MPEAASSPGADTAAAGARGRAIQLTPELVKEIAARVYALMLAESRIERERRRLYARRLQNPDGGRDGA
jgi:hypothetical protein